jgi:hypothetical protein
MSDDSYVFKPMMTTMSKTVTSTVSKMAATSQAAITVATKETEKYIEILEKQLGRYERKIKRNERELKKPYVLRTPGADSIENVHELWLCDIAVIKGRQNTELVLPKHRENLEILRGDIEKLRMGRGTDEISPQSRATIFSRKWSLGQDWKAVMNQFGGLMY